MTDPVPLAGLLPASWRGIRFYMVDSSSQAGRRWQSFAFPGADFTSEEDLGLLNGQIRITGMIVGDDYIIRGEALAAAFSSPGPGVLVHPWRGPKLVVAIEPAEFTHRADRLRAVVFNATFIEYGGGPGAMVSTLFGVVSAITGLNVAALGLAVAAFALDGPSAAFPLVAGALLGGFSLAPQWSLISMLPAFAFLLSSAVSASSGSSAGSSFSGWCGAVSAAGKPVKKPAMGAGPVAATATPLLDPRQSAKLLFGTANALQQSAPALTAQSFLTASARAYALAAAATSLADISYESRDEALSYRALASDALASAAQEAASLTVYQAKPAGALWTALTELKRRVIEDIDERIGRLQSVTRIDLGDSASSAWLVAQKVSGDTPAKLLDTFNDLVTRNRPNHPSALGPGIVDVLP